ncbi:pirin family protein [Undibacterium sp. TJN25]|uniref:pirin family protein n=1 Tax=Undibacterium sp. TJN25 TaxID=3413056 RepID=UPI003BF34CE5
MNQIFTPLAEKASAAVDARKIIYRTKGKAHGGITRLVSPGDLGELIKPFVFLDLFSMSAGGPAMNMHPHSGIATVTVVLDGSLEYRETTGQHGTLSKGGVEWMSAGGGVWHGGNAVDHVRGFQLWLALPQQDENSPAHSRYMGQEEVQAEGPVRVIIGNYGKAGSKITTSASINYLQVTLRDGERWRYQPPAGHTVAWAANASGKLHVAGAVLDKEVAVFQESNAALEFVAEGDTEFVIGSAVKHPHELVTGYYSVHTSNEALQRGETEIRRIGAELRAAGKL